MAVSKKVVDTGTKASKVLGYSSRYAKYSILLVGEESAQTLPLYEITRMYPKDISDKIYQITAATQYRPDLCARDCYDEPSLWWFLAEVNKLFDIEDWTVGKTLRVPSMSKIGAAYEEGNII